LEYEENSLQEYNTVEKYFGSIFRVKVKAKKKPA
jgi:hypothetical protein